MTLFIGKNHIHCTEISSTNDKAIELLQNNIPEGTVITTLHQNNGRGQSGNVWQSETGKNVLFSVVLYPKFLQVQEQFYLTMAMALAVQKTIQHFISDKSVQIKWANDILVEGKKISGMLIENQISGNRWQSTVVGIGINVNQSVFDSSIHHKTTSCIMETNKETDLFQWYKALCEYIELYYLKLKNHGAEHIKGDYTQNMAGYQEKRNYIINQQIMQGIVLGVDKQGKLALQQENSIFYYALKEIEWVFT
jgi:BirA family biotin operon repressor/biotin-[acetyl-CoA-carboxylase] ligase